MHLYRKALVALVAVVVLGAVGAGSASASEWYVAGAPLSGSTGLAGTPEVTQAITFTAIQSEISCAGIELKNATITAHNGGQIEHMVFSECRMAGNTCQLGSTKIESKPLTLTAALGSKSPEDAVTVKPTTGTVFAEFKLTGSECTVKGTTGYSGSLKLLLPKGREELAAQEFLPRAPERELSWGAASVTLGGAGKLKLATGKNWSFH